MGKFFAKTHSARLNCKFPNGLVATALFIEAYVPIEGRDDEAFRETLRAISYRSKYSPVYANGVQVSDEKDTDRIGRLIEEAKASVVELGKLDSGNTTASDAGKAWKKVFRHSFFDEVEEAANSAFVPLEKKSALAGMVVAAPFVASQTAAALSEGERAERMESAIRARKERGGGGKPWSS
jgi:hypothetical protein